MKFFPFLLVCASFGISACSSSPDPEYYTLSSVAGTVQTQQVKAPVIKVRRPVIPVTLDRPEMVSQSDNFRISESDNRLWSEPLDTMIERVFAEDLRTRLPHSMIVTESDGVTVKEAYVVDVDIQQFGTDGQGNALIQAQAVIRTPKGKETSVPVMLHGARVASAESMAKALSILLGDVSDRAAAALHP